jgi:GntR family transcriptional regulator, transcriptional repressor for pyruvate dehydrogenase complex
MTSSLTSQGPREPHVRRVRVPKTAELVVDRFRREIIFGQLREGDPLPSETELSEQFGVSRPTLREAYRILESEGLISIARGAKGGARVHSPNEEVAARYTGWVMQFRQTSLAEIYEARIALEAPCAQLAAERRTREDLDRLKGAVEASAAVLGDATLCAQRQLAFHALVVDISENRALHLLAKVIDVILDRADERFAVESSSNASVEKLWEREQRGHVKLVTLIEARDGTGAAQLWRAHLDESAKRVLQSLGSTSVIEFMD